MCPPPPHHHHVRHLTMRGTPLQTTGLISASPESQPSSSDAKTQLTDFFQYHCFTCDIINIYPTPPLEQDMTQGQLLSGI